MQFHEARILVAGATGVLGRGLARALADEGANVALAGRDRDRLQALGDELSAPTAVLDLNDPAAIPGCVGAAAAALGGLDGIVVATGVVASGPSPSSTTRPCSSSSRSTRSARSRSSGRLWVTSSPAARSLR